MGHFYFMNLLLYTPFSDFESCSVKRMDGGQIVSGNKQTNEEKKSKTNKIIQVNPKTQHEKETLLLAIGEKRFEVFFPYLMYMSSRPIVW